MLLSDFLTEAARRFPDKDAAVFAGETISFAVLDRQARQVASRLARIGVGRGDRVAILHENALPGLVYFWGVLRAGAVPVDIPGLAGQAAIEEMLAECRPAALVIAARRVGKLGAVGLKDAPDLLLSTADAGPELAGRQIVALEEILASEPPDGVAPGAPPGDAPHDVALIIYTSGTTGRPKGVMLSHENLHSNILAFNARIGLTSEDSLLVIVPLHFIHGRIQLLTHTLLGATLYFSGGFQFPKTVLDELVRFQVTGISGVPFHFITLLSHTKLKSTPLPRLKNLTITGGAPSPGVLRELQDALPNVRLHLNYGQTESSPRLTYLGPDEVFGRVGSCGRPLPGVTLEILGEDDQPIARGEVGQVVASSPGIMKGYVSGDERTSGRIDSQGRLRTGDLGRLDGDGYLYLAGRSSEMIKSAGERIFPREIEEVLDAMDGVAESAVLGLPDPILGEKLVACVALNEGATISVGDLRTHCLKSLPFVRTPREVRFVPAIPKTASGKIARAALWSAFISAGE